MKYDISKLKETAKLIRKDIIDMTYRCGEGHIATAFSSTEIITSLYFNVLRLKPKNPDWDDRDRFILSKGHGCYTLYSALARRGFFPLEELDTIGEYGSKFGGHPDRGLVPGIEVSSGSLGHGLSLGVGMAIAGMVDKRKSKVYVLLGDGECQEGSIWEAALFAPMHQLDNLVVIVDYNRQQAINHLDDVVRLDPFADKWKAFGWETMQVNGHSFEELLKAFDKIPFKAGKPSVIIADTVKGKGVTYMEKNIIWHARAPCDKEYKQAIDEIDKKEVC